MEGTACLGSLDHTTLPVNPVFSCFVETHSRGSILVSTRAYWLFRRLRRLGILVTRSVPQWEESLVPKKCWPPAQSRSTFVHNIWLTIVWKHTNINCDISNHTNTCIPVNFVFQCLFYNFHPTDTGLHCWRIANANCCSFKLIQIFLTKLTLFDALFVTNISANKK